MAKNKSTAPKRELSPREALLVRTPGSALVEVWAFKENKIIRMPGTMTFEEFLNLKKSRGWRYQTFEPGQCSLKETN